MFFRYITVANRVCEPHGACFWRLPLAHRESPPPANCRSGNLSGEEGPQEHKKKAGTPTMARIDCSSTAVRPALGRSHATLSSFSAFCTRRFRGIGSSTTTRKSPSAQPGSSRGKRRLISRCSSALDVGVSLLVLTTHSAYSTQLMIPISEALSPRSRHPLVHPFTAFWPLALCSVSGFFVGVVIVGSSKPSIFTGRAGRSRHRCTVIAAGALRC